MCQQLQKLGTVPVSQFFKLMFIPQSRAKTFRHARGLYSVLKPGAWAVFASFSY